MGAWMNLSCNIWENCQGDHFISFFFFRKRNSNKPELEVSLIFILFVFYLVFNFVKSATKLIKK